MGIPIVAGYGSKNKCIESFIAVCPFCGKKTTLKIYETSNNVNVYFVPVAKFNKHFYLVCHLCDKAVEISKEQKEEMLYKIKAVNEVGIPQIHSCEQETSKAQMQKATNGIQVLTGNMEGRQFELVDGKTYTVGKDSNLANILFDASYNMVSRVHCNITYNAKFDKYFIIDCSSNGTYIENGTRLVKNARTPIARGTVLKLADDNCKVLFM